MKIISPDPSSILHSNSLNRGIHSFTSLLSDKTKFVFLNDHVSRLLKGADYLFPQYYWAQKSDEIKEFLKSQFVPSHYFRLSIVEDELIFLKKPHSPKSPYVSLANAQTLKLPSLIPTYLKASNYLLAELELKEALKKKCDEVIFFDQHSFVTEASTSNVFAVLDEKTILTPKLSSMVLAGVTRGRLIDFLKSLSVNVMEADISKSELESSREIWLTNAIQGIRLVERYDRHDMFRDQTLYQSVCHRFGRFGENYIYE